MPKSRKALNYDLDDNLLKKYYPNPKSYKNAWTEVKKFLYNKGFVDRQYSGVVSKNVLSYAKVEEITMELDESLDWLAPCVLKFDVTNIGPFMD